MFQIYIEVLNTLTLPSAPSLLVPIISNQLQTALTAPVTGLAAFLESRA